MGRFWSTGLMLLLLFIGFGAMSTAAHAGMYTTTYFVNGKIVTCTTWTDVNGNPINVVCQ